MKHLYYPNRLNTAFNTRYARAPEGQFMAISTEEARQHPFVTLVGYDAEKKALLVSPSGKFPVMALLVDELLQAACKAYLDANNLKEDQMTGLRLVCSVKKTPIPDTNQVSIATTWRVLPAL